AHGYALAGVARSEGEGRRRAGQHTLDQAAFQSHRAGLRVDVGAPRFEYGNRSPRHHLHPKILENPQRRQVYGLELIGRQHFHGQVRIAHFSPRQLRNATAVKASGAAPLTSPARVHDYLTLALTLRLIAAAREFGPATLTEAF